MFAIINLLYSFLNKLSNGIYPEQSIDNYNKEKKEELDRKKEEQNIEDIIDNEIKNSKIKKLNIIHNNLKSHTTIIINISKDNEINLTILCRIYYILFNLINNFSFFDENYNKKLYKLNKFVNSLIYTSPFDNEEIIIDKLLLLIEYLNNYFSNNTKIKKIIEYNLDMISIYSIIDNINSLSSHK